MCPGFETGNLRLVLAAVHVSNKPRPLLPLLEDFR